MAAEDTTEAFIKLIVDTSEVNNFKILNDAINGSQEAILQLLEAAEKLDPTGKAIEATFRAINAQGDKLSVTLGTAVSNMGELITATAQTAERSEELTKAQATMAAELNRVKESATTQHLLDQQNELKKTAEANHQLELAQNELSAALNRSREAAQTDYLLGQQQAMRELIDSTYQLWQAQDNLAATLNRVKEAAAFEFNEAKNAEILAQAEAAHQDELAQRELAAALNQVKEAARTDALLEQQKQLLDDAIATQKAADEMANLSAQIAKVNAEQAQNNALLRDRDRAAQTIFSAIGQQLGPVHSQATPDEINARTAALNRFINLVREGKLTAQEALAIFENVSRGIQALYGPVEQQAAKSAQEIIDSNKRIGNSFAQLQGAGKKSSQDILISWQSMTRFFVTHLAYTAVYRLIGSLKEGIKAASDFELQLGEIRTISEKNALTVDQWAANVRKLSDAFGTPIKDVAEGTYQTLSNQIAKGADATRFLGEAMQFARTTMASTDEGVNLLSSALNAYNLNISQTHEIAAGFFKTIDLGRVRAGELANTFGRVAALSTAMGVSLNETEAAITTLTRQGIKYDEAFTLINGLLLKLIKPTEQMKKLFEEWGVASGQAAVSTFGFQGVLEKIEQAAGGSSTELGEMLSNVRAIRGAIGLTGSAFKTYSSDLQQIRNSTADYNAAISEIKDNAGFKLQQELEKLKNTFTVDWGRGALKSILDWTEAAGGLVGVIKTALTISKDLLITWVALKAVPASIHIWTAAVNTINTALGRQVALTVQLTEAEKAEAAARNTLFSFGAAVAIAGLLALKEYSDSVEQYMLKSQERGEQIFSDFYEKESRLYQETLIHRSEFFNDFLNREFQGINSHISGLRRLYSDQGTALEESYKQLSTKLKESFDNILGAIKDEISDAVSTSRSAATEIKSIQEDLIRSAKKLTDDLFRFQFDSAEPLKQAQLAKDAIAKALAQGNSLKFNPTVDNDAIKLQVDAAKAAYDEAYVMAKELAQKRIELDKEIAKKQEELAKANTKSEYDAKLKAADEAIEAATKKQNANALQQAKDEKARLVQEHRDAGDDERIKKLQEELTTLQKQADALGTVGDISQKLQDIENQRTQKLLEAQTVLDKRRKDADEEVAHEEQRFNDLKSALAAVEKFKLFDNKGELLFKTPADALKKFQELQQQVIDNIGPQQVELYGLLHQQANDVKAQLDNQYNKKYLDELQIRLDKEKQLITSNYQQLQKALEDLDKKRADKLKEVSGLLETLGNLRGRFAGNSVLDVLDQKDLKTLIGGPKGDGSGGLQQMLKDFARSADPATFKAIQGTVDQLIPYMQTVITDLQGPGHNKAGRAKDAQELLQTLTRLQQILPTIKDLKLSDVTPKQGTIDYDKFQKLLEAIGDLNFNDAQKALTDFPNQLQQVEAAIAHLGLIATPTFNNLLGNMPTTIKDTITDVQKLTEEIKKLKEQQGQLPIFGPPNRPISFRTDVTGAGIAPTALASTSNIDTLNINIQVPALTGNAAVDYRNLATGLREGIRRGDFPPLA